MFALKRVLAVQPNGAASPSIMTNTLTFNIEEYYHRNDITIKNHKHYKFGKKY